MFQLCENYFTRNILIYLKIETTAVNKQLLLTFIQLKLIKSKKKDDKTVVKVIIISKAICCLKPKSNTFVNLFVLNLLD